ncbi:sigma-70 family RNA polymerase sigma factor [Dactylosporangium sp. CA-233914]|uniref:sigma-70 family RNA polymerase sigma factor n=1 Tax=Dactylosporangium sp. CA-233914 TaxID=3239934 RepID=UPI003D91F38E
MRDSDTFDEFYASSASRMVTQLYAMIGDLAEAEDVVQEAYARAWQRWRRVSAYENPASWVRTVAYRLAVSSWRRSRNRRTADQRFEAGRQVRELNPDTVALVAALRQISASQRRAIVLYHLIGLSVREIAQETGSSQSAVKAQLSRGRQALAPLLGVEELTEARHHA